jgi:Zn-dependent metalloprotease
VVSSDGVFRVFIDAKGGAELLRYSEIQTQSAVGTGVGLNGDTKKLSMAQQAGQYVADDRLRPTEPDHVRHARRPSAGCSAC